MPEVKCRWAPSLGDLEGTAEEAWGTKSYDPEMDLGNPCVFFGLYGLPDFYALWKHRGKKWILWSGSDIRYFVKGYWLDGKGRIKMNPAPLAKWIRENCESWVENQVEMEALKKFGIISKVAPSFLGNVDDYKASYRSSDRPEVYTSVSGDDFDLYRWKEVEELAAKHPNVDFYLYGNSKPWETNKQNIFVRGKIPKEAMNNEIKYMQGALRLLPFEGFSEIIAKSVLWGQWPISAIAYPHTLSVSRLGELVGKKSPNVEGREYYRRNLNDFPWVKK